MTDVEIEGKFRSLAGKMLPAARIDALLRQLWKLEELPGVGRLVEMTVPEAARKADIEVDS